MFTTRSTDVRRRRTAAARRLGPRPPPRRLGPRPPPRRLGPWPPQRRLGPRPPPRRPGPRPRLSVPPPSSPSRPVVASSFAAALLLPLAVGFLVGASTACYVYPADVADPCAGKKCSFGAHCVASVDGLVARCQCLQSCSSYGDSVDSWPVCSTDGVDYDNVCEMRKASCRLMADIEKKYDGKCGEMCLKLTCFTNLSHRSLSSRTWTGAAVLMGFCFYQFFVIIFPFIWLRVVDEAGSSSAV